MIGIVYFGGHISSDHDTAIKVATSSGTVVGQVGFGILADIVGRKRMYGLELMVIIFATLAQSLSSQSPGMSIIGLIVFWRIIMGIGIGYVWLFKTPFSSKMLMAFEQRRLSFERDHHVRVCNDEVERLHDECRLRNAGTGPIGCWSDAVDRHNWFQGVFVCVRHGVRMLNQHCLCDGYRQDVANHCRLWRGPRCNCSLL